jgi:hypothetical protein
MTAHCANSACGATFRYFRYGKMYLIDFKLNGNTAREMEYFWLCGDCSPKMRVTFDSEGHVLIEQLEAPASLPKDSAAVELRVHAKALSA